MSHGGELTFCQLRCKEIVNIIDGRRLGRMIDLIIDGKTCRIRGIVAPSCDRRLFLFRSRNEIFIPWERIRKIGEDTILVELGHFPRHQRGGRGDRRFVGVMGEESGDGVVYERGGDNEERGGGDRDGNVRVNSKCDGKCEKCMMFDCQRRWKKDVRKCNERFAHHLVDNMARDR
ncbi:MAG: YlmC/YmxH family sporulation protein [Firmicutes bacterium]|nr:YlmC/YmxH family sporulation protein [Bacillota bacterium]